MESDSRSDAEKAASEMLNLFASVGATAFDLTITTKQGEKAEFRKNVSLAALRRQLPGQLDKSAWLEQNVIVRPHGPAVDFIQLDDLNAERMERVKPAAFLALLTSPGNGQAWIALPKGQAGEDFARRLRKGAGADPTASGATRVAGSLNFKDKYAPDFPRVEIAASSPGQIATREQLAAAGLVAAPEKPPAPSPLRSPSRRPGPHARKWPSYERCLAGAPPNHDKTGPDVSRADFTWCMTAIDWEWSVEDTAARLMELSSKAQENGERYALLTAQNAAAAVARRQSQRRG